MITRIGIAQTTSSMLAREGPVRQVARALVFEARIPPGEAEGRDDRRHDDRQHDRERVDQDGPLGAPDRTARIEHARLTGGEHQRHGNEEPTRPPGHAAVNVA